MTKKQLTEILASRTKLDRKVIDAVLDALSETAKETLEEGKDFVVPGVVHMRAVHVPATKARKGINPFTGQEMTFPARPAAAKVRGRSLVKVTPKDGAPISSDDPAFEEEDDDEPESDDAI